MQQEYKILLRLGLPIVAGQLGVTLQGVVDTIMLGHYSTGALAAVGFDNSLFTFTSVVVMGFAAGVIPLCGADYGAGDTRGCTSILRNALIVITLVGLVASAVLGGVFLRIDLLGQPRELHADMLTYLWWTLPSLMAVAWAATFKSFFDSLNATRVAMYAILAGNVWNVLWNYLLIFGRLGLPELGVAGAGIATTTSRFLILLIYIGALLRGRDFAPYRRAWREARLSLRRVRKVASMGVAIAVQSGFEVGSFSLCTLFVGWLGKEALAAHQVMIAVTTTIWIVYFSIASATAVRVSNHTGRGDYAAVRFTSRCGLRMILLMAVVLNILFLCSHTLIFGLFTDDPRLLPLLLSIVPAVVLYQFSDATQTHYVNVLRGMGCVRYLMADAFTAYLLVCMPLAFCLSIVCGFGLVGVWMSYPVALTVAAALYIRRYRRHLRRMEKPAP